MAIIIPAVLEKEKEEFWRRCEAIEKLLGVTRAQVDFCDGKFVKNSSLPVQEIDVLNPVIEWEAHLMIEEPVDFFDYKMVGFTTVIVHLEAFTNEDLIQGSLQEIKRLGMKAGLAINPETPVEALLPYAGLADQFLLMTVHPGLQGQEFLPESLERIRDLRNLSKYAIIEIDGGVNKNNIKAVIDAGADMCVVGSALNEDHDIFKSWDQLSQIKE